MRKINKILRFLLCLIIVIVSPMFFSSKVLAATVPEVVITGYEVSDKVVKEGNSFQLTLHVKNASTTTAVQNVVLSLDIEDDYIYSDFGKGNQAYIDSIEPQQETTVVFEMKAANQAPDIVKTSIGISFALDDGSALKNSLFIWIPVESKGFIQIPEFTITNQMQEGEKARLNIMMSNAGDTDISSVHLVLKEGNTELINDIISRSLPISTSTSYENYIEKLGQGEHSLSAVIEYTAITGEVYPALEKSFTINVTQKSVTESNINSSMDKIKLAIRIVIGILMLLCIVIIRKQVKLKVLK